MIKKYSVFITEKMKMSDLELASRKTIKSNIINKMKEWSSYILDNIEVKEGVVTFKKFDKLQSKIMLREFTNEFTKEMADELKIEGLINSVSDAMESKNKDIKRVINRLFAKFINDTKMAEVKWEK